MQLLLLSFILPIVLGGALPGREKCVWGPPYWCSHVTHARECGATQHCLQTVWKNQIIKPKSTETCTYCQLITNAFRDAIEYPATQAQIEAALVNVCAILQGSDTRDLCQGIVQEYVPELIQMFEKDISTDMICATLGLCSGLEDRWSPYGVKSSNNSDCSDCTKFFTDVQQSITSNETLNQLLQLLNQTVCSELGAFSQTCIDLASQYLPVALQVLASQLDPNIVCRIFGFCSVDGTKADTLMMKNIFSERISKGVIKYRSDAECDICKDFVKEFDTIIEDPAKQNELYSLIRNNFCAQTGAFIIQCHQFTMTYLPGIIKYLAYKFQMCHHLVDGYVPPLISMIANKIQMDPTITCKIVGLCAPVSSKDNMVQMMSQMFTAKKSKAAMGGKVGDEECDICKDLINQVDEFVRDKDNQDKVIYELKNVVCPELGTFQDECKELVDEYAPMLFELLVNELDPSTICEQVGFCQVPSSLNVIPSNIEGPAGMVGAGYVKLSVDCIICQEIQTVVDNLLKENETVKTVNDLMNKVCKRLPTEQLDKQCEDFVDKFGQEMIDKLAKENVCKLIGVCPEARVEVKKGSDAACQLCQVFVSISKSLIANISQDEILSKVRDICSFIPGNYSATCLNYVNVYGPLVISALKSEDPKSLCELLTACPAVHIPYMTKPIPETLPAWKAPSKECEFCDTAVVMLKYLLKNKATEAQLEDALKGLCDYAGALKSVCENAVTTYGDRIIALVLNNLNANQICGADLGLCTEVKKQSSVLSAIMSPYNTLPVGKVMEVQKGTVKAPSEKCELCDTVVVMMKYYLASNATDEEIKEAMDTLCGYIPSTEVKGLCTTLVDENIVYILQLLRKELNATYICTKLGFCEALTKPKSLVSVIMSPYDTLPLIQPVQDKKDVKSSDECELCKMAINMMKNFIKENATEDIRKVVEKFCTKIPAAYKSECDNLIKEYGDMIIKLLVEKADTDKICKEIKLCTASISEIMSPYVTLPVGQHVSEKKVPVKAGNAVECEACKYIMNILENKLQDNKTEENIKAALKTICKDIPATFTAQCITFVDRYADAVINFIVLDVSPDEICKELSLCTSNIRQLPKPVHVKLLKHDKGTVGSTECDVCLVVMKVIDTFLGENRTEASIRKVLEEVCADLPDTISSECQQLVKTYESILIKLLLQNLDPKSICTDIKLCPSQSKNVEALDDLKASPVTCEICTVIMGYLENTLKKNATEAEIQDALDKLCSYLPSSIKDQCTAFVNEYTDLVVKLIVQGVTPDQVCKELQLCTSGKIIPGKQTGSLKSKASPQCVLCEFVITQIDNYLKGNRSEVAITTALEKVCSLLPDTITTECREFVDQYSKVIISLLVQNVDPEKICSTIKLCTAKAISPMGFKLPMEMGLHKGSGCVLCEFVMKQLDDILKENATKAEIQAALDKVCDYLPSEIKDECTAFVNEYTDLVVSLIALDISPDQVCSALRLCTSGRKSHWGAFVKILPGNQKVKSDLCGPCKLVMESIEEYVKQNKTAEEIEDYIKRLCDMLPDTVTAQCHDVVDQYIPAILALIGQNLKPEEICQQLGFCNATVTHSKDDNTLYFNSHKLVGVSKCTYGPAYWCANKENAVECNAMEHCRRHVWN